VPVKGVFNIPVDTTVIKAKPTKAKKSKKAEVISRKVGLFESIACLV
jgi:hypothetical protein